jgi:hypothetical protein
MRRNKGGPRESRGREDQSKTKGGPREEQEGCLTLLSLSYPPANLVSLLNIVPSVSSVESNGEC